MTLADEVRALRHTTTVAPGDHIAAVRVRGAGAADLLERVSPRSLYARAGKMAHTMFLDEAARPIADVYLCCDEDDWLVLAEGMSAAAVIDYLAPYATGLSATLEDQAATHAMLCLGGPYAWELLGELTTPDVIGLPYLGFFHEGRFTIFRGGKTGEYGYDLFVERAQLGAVRDRLATIGAKFGLAEISLAALDVAGLENFFWNARRHTRAGLTPIEVQQQWRVAYDREFPGSAALVARRAAATHRSVLVASTTPIAIGAPITLDGRAIGDMLDAAQSPTRGDWIGVAVVEKRFAHAGLELDAVHTISAPSINNRSLYVDPQRHSFATRETDAFPAILR